MNETLRRKSVGAIILDLSDFKTFAECQPIVMETYTYIGGYRINLSCILGSLNMISCTVEVVKTKIFLDMDLNTKPNVMGFIGKTIKRSGAAMISVHCSSGPESIKNFVDEMKKDSMPFQEDWEIEEQMAAEKKAAEEKKAEAEKNAAENKTPETTAPQEIPEEKPAEKKIVQLPVRPLIFAVTIPSQFEPATAYQYYGEYHGRMNAMKGVVGTKGFDGVICTPRNLRLYNGMDDLKKMVDDVDPRGTRNGQGKMITPSGAIEADADYLIIKDAILKPPAGSSMKEEAERILAEISLAIEKKSRLKATYHETRKPRTIATTATKSKAEPKTEPATSPKSQPAAPPAAEKVAEKKNSKRKKGFGIFSRSH